MKACLGLGGLARCDEFDSLQLTEACVAEVEAATCEEHNAETPAYLDVCFPPCHGSEPRCSGLNLIECAELEGRMHTITTDCDTYCEDRDEVYTGTCGRSDGTESTSVDTCWCRPRQSRHLPPIPRF
jgi:hypothetical protein